MSLEDFMIPCFTKKLFGIECFGCGMQRSLLMVFKGNLQEAWNLYPAVFPFLIFISFLAISFVDKTRNYSKLIIGSAIVMALVMVVSYFFRHPIF
jgi:hypothetical protein